MSAEILLHRKITAALTALLIISPVAAGNAAPAGARKQSPFATILIAHPVNAALDTKKDAWFGAVAEAALHFKLGAIDRIRLVPRDTVAAHVPFGEGGKEAYRDLAQKMGASHVVHQKYEVVRDRELQYMLEVVGAGDDRIVGSVESLFSITDVSLAVDSGVTAVAGALGIAPSEDVKRFLRIPVLSGDLKIIKRLGALLDDCDGGKAGPARCCGEHGEIASAQNSPLVSLWLGAGFCLSAGDRAGAAELLDGLLRIIGGVYPDLFAVAADCYTATGRPDDGLRMALLADQRGVSSLDLSVAKARAFAARGDHDKAQMEFDRVLKADPEHPGALLYLARKANTDSMPARAIEYTDRVLTQRSNDVDARLEKAQALLSLGRNAQARDELLKAQRTEPSNGQANLLLGDAYMRLGNPSRAQQYYESAVAIMPDNPGALFQAAIASKKAGKRKEALELLLRIPYSHASTPAVLHEMGLLEYKLKDTANARAHLEAYARSGQSDYETLMILGALRAAGGNHEGAIKTYFTALNLAGDKNACRIAIAQTMIESGQHKQALPYAEEVLRTSPRDPQALELASAAHEASGNHAKAASLLERLLKAPGGAGKDRAFHLGELYEKAGKAQQAVTRYARNIAAYRTDTRNHERLGAIYMEQKKYSSAQRVLMKAANTPKPTPGVLKLAGQAHDLGGKGAQAITFYELYLKQAPEDIPVLTALGNLHASRRKYRKAVETLKKAVGIDKRCSACWERLGDVHVEAKQYREAAGCYSRARDLAEGNAMLSVKLGRVQILDGKPDKALGFFRRAHEVNPANEEALYHIVHDLVRRSKIGDADKIMAGKQRKTGWGFLAEGEWQEAKENHKTALAAYKKAVSSMPSNAVAQAGYGRMLITQRAPTNAIAALSRAMALEPDNPEIIADLARARTAKNHLTLAVKLFYKAVKLDEKNGALYAAIGKIETNRRRRSKAIDAYEKAIKYGHREAEIYLALGHECRRTGKHKKAIDAYRQAERNGDKEIKLESWRWTGNVYWSGLKEREKAKEFYRKYVKAGGTHPTLIKRAK